MKHLQEVTGRNEFRDWLFTLIQTHLEKDGNPHTLAEIKPNIYNEVDTDIVVENGFYIWRIELSQKPTRDHQ